jgi:hypothetical protein
MGSKPIFRSERLGKLVSVAGGGPTGGRADACGGSNPSPSALISPIDAAPSFSPSRRDKDPSRELMLRLAGVTSTSRAPLHTNPVALSPRATGGPTLPALASPRTNRTTARLSHDALPWWEELVPFMPNYQTCTLLQGQNTSIHRAAESSSSRKLGGTKSW